jgi:hypothetical protein
MDRQPQSRAPLIIAIVLLLLPVLYVGSYLALVVPEGISLVPPGLLHFPATKTLLPGR